MCKLFSVWDLPASPIISEGLEVTFNWNTGAGSGGVSIAIDAGDGDGFHDHWQVLPYMIPYVQWIIPYSLYYHNL